VKDSIALEDVSQIGFGCYRIVSGVSDHQNALVHALSLGCTLIDTASNYSDGLSEKLIGEVLSANSQYPAFLVTKAGYITHSFEKVLGATGVNTEQLQRISAESKYSISPDVLNVQLAVSLERLQRSWLDGILLHNPEHYFDCNVFKKSPHGYYSYIQRAFEFFEECVAEGKLRYYGVSSNILALSGHHEKMIHLEHLLATAKAVSTSHHFRLLEFPFNLVETESLVRQSNGLNLIENIRANGLVSIGNRPLNGKHSTNLLRLATYEDEVQDIDISLANDRYERCIEIIHEQITAEDIPHGVMDFKIMQFLRDNRYGIEHPDTVDQIFRQHFYPFVESLWNGFLPDEPRYAFSELYKYARLYAKQHLSEKGQYLRAQLIDEGVIDSGDIRSLAVIACDFGLQSGLNHVVVGMRTVRYVNNLRELIQDSGRISEK
jgi:aryl-alcohol dehydrogenase-like predicted oxidoreductase